MFHFRPCWSYLKSMTNQRGVTIVEYAVILVLVAVMVIIVNPEMRSQMSVMFSGISSFLNSRSAGLN